MNELSKIAMEDGQDFRPFMEYFQDTFSHLKGKNLSSTHGEVICNEPIEFYQHLISVLEFMVQHEQDELVEEKGGA